jgi:DNA replication protein DnaC
MSIVVNSTIENSPENSLVGLSEDSFRNPPESLFGNSPENPLGNPPENPLGNPPENSLGNSPESPFGNSPENPLGNPPENSLGNPPENSLGNPPENSLGNPPENSLGNPPENPLENPPENSLGNPPENSLGNPPENSLGNPLGNFVGTFSRNPLRDPLESPSKKPEETLERIEILVRLIYYLLINCSDRIIEFIAELKDLLDFDIGPLIARKVETLNVLRKISQILCFEFESFSIEKEPSTEPSGEPSFSQTMNCETIHNFFIEIMDKNIHNVEKDGVLYECKYHKESLFAHLIKAMLIALTYCGDDMSVDEKVVVCFIALVHDIGKPSSLRLIKNKTTFTAHGEIGGIILTRILKQFSSFFNDDNIYMIIICVTRHMCGYHCTNFTDHKKHIDRCTDSDFELMQMCYLSEENSSVKNILAILRMADTASKYSDNNHLNIEKVHSTTPDFKDAVNRHYSNYEQIDGTVICITGQSGAGKSTLAFEITKKIIGNFKIISRDMIIYNLIIGGGTEIGFVPTGAEYSKMYEEYKKKKLSLTVNECLINEIIKYLKDGYIVICDTQLTMYKDIFDKKKINIDLFIINIIMARDSKSMISKKDAERLGLSLKDQLKIIGDISTFHPFNNSINQHLIESKMAKKDNFNKNKGNIVIPISWGTESIFFLEIQKWVSIANRCLKSANFNTPEIFDESMSRTKCFEWLQEIYNNIGCNIALFKNKLAEYNIKVDERYNGHSIKIFYVSYIDGICKYHYESTPRHVILAVNTVTNKLHFLRYIMPRGPEGLTTYSIRKEITSTESFEKGNIKHLPEETQTVIEALCNQDPNRKYNLNMAMSSKIDGSLLLIQYIIDPDIRSIYELCMLKAGGIHATLVEICKEREYLIVISTSGTHLISKMLGYFITSFSEGVLGVTVDSSIAPDKVFHLEYFIEGFIRKIESLWGAFPDSFKENQSINVTFEAIVRNRTTAWGEEHNELAVEYNSSGLFLLSIAIINHINYEYIHHTMFNMQLLEQKIFKVPPSWINKSISDISNMVEDLNKCLNSGKIDDFYVKHPPINNDISENIHPEGFVAIVTYLKDGKNFTVYIKLKTVIYYIAHKLKEKDIEKITSLPQSTRDFFPISIKKTEVDDLLISKIVNIALIIKQNITLYLSEGKFEDLDTKLQIYLKGFTPIEGKIKSLIDYLEKLRNAKEPVKKEIGTIINTLYGVLLNTEFLQNNNFSQKKIILTILCPWMEEDIYMYINNIIVKKNSSHIKKKEFEELEKFIKCIK